MKYLFQCQYCGGILFKGNDPAFKILPIEIKCPSCKKILKEDDIIINKVKPKRKGLER